VKSHTTKKFWKHYEDLPDNIRKRAEEAWALFSNNPHHPSLRFKKVIDQPTVYSVRITGSYRALGVREDQTIIWFWIGNHDDYEQLLKNL